MLPNSVLGDPRDPADRPALCSRCGARIAPEKDRPLYVFGNARDDGSCDVWQYCPACEVVILEAIRREHPEVSSRT